MYDDAISICYLYLCDRQWAFSSIPNKSKLYRSFLANLQNNEIINNVTPVKSE